MLQEIVKNLWLLLTIIIPGFFTYGLWRILLILEPVTLKNNILNKVDASVLLTTSFIVAIGLLQQAGSIVVEFLLTLISKAIKDKFPLFHELICGRFALTSAGKLDESTTRIVGNFFLSMNISMGVVLIYTFYKCYVSNTSDWVFIFLYITFGITIISTFFRMFNAMSAIKECIEK